MGARVDDEVLRINQDLVRADRCSSKPAVFRRDCGDLWIPLGRDRDQAFMELVRQRFADAGWTATLTGDFDIDGSLAVLVLRHPGIAAAPTVLRELVSISFPFR